MTDYDYIIVGAGSAGCVLANRLSADPAIRVLLIEAGGRDNALNVRMPAGTLALLTKPNRFNWSRISEEQPHLDNRRTYWPSGRGWGGTSSINGMAYLRGQPADYDGWAAQGLSDWSFDALLPYFKLSEDNARGADDFHATGGPLHVSDPRGLLPLSRAFLDAGVAAGHPLSPDFNGAQQEGVGVVQLTIRKGIRWSTSRAFLHPILSRPNLTVASYAHVTRLLTDGTHVRGVEFKREGRLHQRSAAREVILSAGVVSTPQLLMLSGIGDATDLRQHGITVVADRPEVGRNLQDHIDCMIQHECPLPVSLYKYQAPFAAMKVGAQYLLRKTGPAAGIGVEVGAFLKSDPALATPDLQMSFTNALMTETGVNRHGFMIHVWHLRPDSRGYITLRSRDPMEPPVIQPNYLSRPKEALALRSGIRFARNILNQAPFDPYRGAELSPGPSVQSDAEIDSFMRATATGLWHPVGTARMGVDADAVVDARLRVNGVTGLRIADASIMPTVVSANTNAAVIMIAEKAAAMILEDARRTA